MSERHTELVDAAQDMQEENNQRAIRQAQAGLLPETHPDFDGKHCVDGGELIPAERLAMGRVRCVHCQDLKERGSRQRR